MTEHKVVGRAEWQAARDELLQREKAHTRMGDELALQRRELPWVAIDKDYRFDTDDGPRTLAELFDGRSQLLVYHFMFGPSYQAGDPVNSSIADTLDALLPHLQARDVTLVLVSRAPLAKLQAYRRRMGWRVPWVSSANTDFNLDLGASSTGELTPAGRAAADRGPERGRGRDRRRWLSVGGPGGERLCPPGRRRPPDLCDHLARGRVPDGLLPDPGPDAQGP